MDQMPLLVDSMEEALRGCVVAAGGPKKVASLIWPPKGIQEAARYLNHCLDPERPEKLAPSEIQMIARLGIENDCHTFMHYMAQQLGYQTPKPIEPESEMARLQREFNRSVQLQKQIARQMERMMTLREVG